MRWWLVLLALGGCDYILGVNAYDHGDAQSPDGPAGPEMVTGTYRVHWLDNDPIGVPRPHNDAPSTGTSAAIRFADGTSQPIMFDAAGAFSFTNPHAGQTYALHVTTPYLETEYQLGASVLQLVERFAGRIDRVLVPPNTSVLVNISGQTTGPVKDELHSTGVWSRSGLDTDPLDWTTVAGDGGPMGLLDGTKHDAVIYAHYMSSGSTMFTALDSYVLFPNQTTKPMMMTSLTGSVTNPIPSNCSRVISGFDTELERAISLHSGASAAFSGWQINADPNPEFALLARFPLVYALAGGDVDVQPAYANPYGTEVDAATTILMAYGGTGTQITTVVPIAANTCPGSPTMIPQGLVAIPIDVTLASVSLFAPGTPTIAIDRSSPVPVAWTISSGTADYYAVTLEEAVSTTYKPLYTIITTKPSATIDPARFGASAYRLSVHAYLGTPNAHAGDFADLAGPAVEAVEETLTFKVN